MPYRVYMDQLLQFLRHANLWKSCVPLICFSTVVWHQVDRVKLQFGLIQEIPQSPMNMDELHKLDKRGNQDVNWAHRHAEWISIWGDRHNRILQGQLITGPPVHTHEYMTWYLNNSRPFLSMDQHLNDPRIRNTSDSTHSTSAYQGQSLHETISQLVVNISDINEPGRMSVQYTAPPHPDHTNLRHSFVTPQNEYYANLFGVTMGTPESANTYIHQHSDAPGSSSMPRHDYQEEEQPPEEPPDTQPPMGRLQGRRQPPRNRNPPPCGTGHHLGR